jgi:hypothetical protein
MSLEPITADTHIIFLYFLFRLPFYRQSGNRAAKRARAHTTLHHPSVKRPPPSPHRRRHPEPTFKKNIPLPFCFQQHHNPPRASSPTPDPKPAPTYITHTPFITRADKPTTTRRHRRRRNTPQILPAPRAKIYTPAKHIPQTRPTDHAGGSARAEWGKRNRQQQQRPQ